VLVYIFVLGMCCCRRLYYRFFHYMFRHDFLSFGQIFMVWWQNYTKCNAK